MQMTNMLSFIISILFIIQSCLCQPQQYLKVLNNGTNHTLSANETVTLGDLITVNSLNNHSLILKAITEHSLPINIRTRYSTDEEDYTSTESITFSIRTNQQIPKAITILAGFAYENINYVFDIENGIVTIIFSQDDLPHLILSTKNGSELIYDGQWHQLTVQRSHRKLRFLIDNIEQSVTELSNGWQTNTNIFIGAELTPISNGDYHVEINDIIVTNSDRSLNLREEDNSDENIKDFINPSSQSESSQTLAFLPNDNHQIIHLLQVKSPFKTLSFSFQTYSNDSTFLQFENIKLNIDIHWYLTLINGDKPPQKIFPTNNGDTYLVELDLYNQTLEISTNRNTKISMELSSPLNLIEKFIFGLNNQFLGCIQNITYNNEIFSFSNLSLNRQQCPSNNSNNTLKSTDDVQLNQIISFKEYDRPLIINLDNPEEFHIFSFVFYTDESDSIICSLSDEISENFLILSIRHGHLLLTYNNQEIEILMNQTIHDTHEHKTSIEIRNKKDLLFELDGNIIRKTINEIFSIKRIYIGKLDGFIKQRILNFNQENFIGCIKDIMFNDKSLIKLERIYSSDRLTNTCQFPKRERQNITSYLLPNLSFSIRDYHDIIELEIPPNEEFYHYQLRIKTRSTDGILTSIYSNNDRHGLILFLYDGKLQLRYHSSDNLTSQLIFNDNQIINDGHEHYIFISRYVSQIPISKRHTQITIPLSLSLFFDVIILGGSTNNLFVGCFSNVTYNHQLFIPEGVVKSDRLDCFYDEESICDRAMPCNNAQPSNFCGENDCSLVCTPTFVDKNNRKGLIEYSTQLKSGQYEEIYLTIFTTSDNSTLFMTHNGTMQISIILQNYYPRLIIQNGGLIYTYNFPGRIRGDQWHILQCQKTSDTIDLTFDDETRHYTNLTEDFTLFGNKKIHLCGRNFIGYVQDIILMTDNHHENLIQNSIRNPRLIDYDSSVTWNNRANIRECKQVFYV